jgi:hypothetical protein
MIGTNLAITPKRYAPFGSSNDADAQAFITAANITNGTQQNAVNQLVLDLKSANVWTKMKAIYPIVGGSALTHKWNLKDPRDLDAAFRLNFTTGWTHSSNGMTPLNAYADTFIVPSTNLTLNSMHLSFYSRTNANTASNEIGSWEGAGLHYTMLSLRQSNNSNRSTAFIQCTSGSATFVDTDSLGFYIGTRTSASSTIVYKNGTNRNSTSTTSTGQSTRKIYIGVANGNTLNYSTKQCSFASIGDGLTDTESANFNTAVATFQTTLGRNV